MRAITLDISRHFRKLFIAIAGFLFENSRKLKRHTLLKSKLIFIFLCCLTEFSYSQSNMAFIKPGLKSVNAYDSSKNVLVKVESETFFFCDSLVGEWYNFEMNNCEGFIHKDSIQFFHRLTKLQQKSKINKVLNRFYKICKKQ